MNTQRQPRRSRSAGRALAAAITMIAIASPAFAELALERIGTFQSGLPFDSGAVESVDHHGDGSLLRAYVVNDSVAAVDVFNVDDPTNPTFLTRVDLTVVRALPTDGPTALAVDPLGRGVAIAVSNTPRQDPGWVVFIGLGGAIQADLVVGAFPTALAFSPDGSRLLVANEGVPSSDYLRDPEGSVSIIDTSTGLASASLLTTARLAGIPETGPVRHLGPNAASPELDFEPETVSITADGSRALISLQENNAVAVLDVASQSFIEVIGLGFKDHDVTDNGLDPSDQDFAAAVAPWPVWGMYQPGGATPVELGGTSYLLTANEGDSRDLIAWTEEARVKDLTLSPALLALQDDAALGRLEVTTTLGDADSDGQYEELYAFGARSISLWDVDAAGLPLTWDSADQLEFRTAVMEPLNFNSTSTSNASFDLRSDNKGPEPEAVVTGTVCGRTFVFTALEHMSGVMAFDVTEPANVRYVLYSTSRDFTVAADDPAAGGLGTSGLAFVPSTDSVTGDDLLLVANEVSGLLEVFRVSDPLCTGCGGQPLTARDQLQGVKVGGGAMFSWTPEAAAPSYHLNSVPAKWMLDPIWPHPRPIGIGTVQCSDAAPTCTDADALTDPAPLLFYQALSACGPSASEEGPVF